MSPTNLLQGGASTSSAFHCENGGPSACSSASLVWTLYMHLKTFYRSLNALQKIWAIITFLLQITVKTCDSTSPAKAVSNISHLVRKKVRATDSLWPVLFPHNCWKFCNWGSEAKCVRPFRLLKCNSCIILTLNDGSLTPYSVCMVKLNSTLRCKVSACLLCLWGRYGFVARPIFSLRVDLAT